MKAVTFAAGLSAILLPSGVAHAAVQTYGGSLTQSCYQAAESRDSSRFAVEACTRALTEESPSNADRVATLVNRGIVQMVGGQTVAADADFNAALSANPNLAEALLNKGYLRLRQGNGRDALPFLQQAMDHGAGANAVAVFARGVAYEQVGNYRLAYADLQRARRMAPSWPMPAEYLSAYRVGR